MYKTSIFLSTFLAIILIPNGRTIPMNPYEKMMKRETPQGKHKKFVESISNNKYSKNFVGLYSAEDHVTILSNVNFHETLFERPIASFVEFYNSYCGACQRFSPIYKSLAKNATKWKNYVQIAALDCATDENNDICRQYEIMRYPTMRYFPPKYIRGEKQLGVNLDHLLLPESDSLLNELVLQLQNETQGGADWPQFKKFDGDTWNEILNEVPTNILFVYAVSDDLTGTFAQQAVLDYATHDKIAVRIVDSNNLRLFGDSPYSSNFRLGVVERGTGKFQSISIYNESREALDRAIDGHMVNHNLAPKQSTEETISVLKEDSVGSLLDGFYYEKARLMTTMPLFRADLEQAIRNSLGHEVTQHQTITGEYLSALRNYVSVLTRYYNSDNQNSYRKLLDYLMESSRTEVKGEELQEFLKKLNPPIINDKTRYVGCFSTRPGIRRFPCSLWSLFHYLTVQHLESNHDDDPMEVLHAMHGYIKHFFGCTECSKHFQDMAKRNHIWNVTSKDQAVLWLWSSHNEVSSQDLK